MTGLATFAALALLLASAFLSASETAIFAIGEPRLRTLREEGFRGARALAGLRAQPDAFRLLVLLLNTLTGAGAAGFIVTYGATLGGTRGALLALPAAAAIVLLAGELLPRLILSRRPVRLALTTAPLFAWAGRGVAPLFSLLLRLGGIIASRNGDPASTPAEREVREISLLGQEEGIVEADEHLLVERAFRLDELSVWDVMTPRVDVFAWKDSETLDDIIGEMREVPFSRVPVYGENIDDITGILYVREAYATYVAGRGETPLGAIARDPYFIPGSLSLTRLLKSFQARRIHMGIVADEFGGTDGLVTLEDLLEELVGDIVDETDVARESLVRVSRDEAIAAGGVDLREVSYVFNVTFPPLEHRSLNGYLLEKFGQVPKRGDSTRCGDILLEVLEATDTVVTRVRLLKAPPPGDGEGE